MFSSQMCDPDFKTATFASVCFIRSMLMLERANDALSSRLHAKLDSLHKRLQHAISLPIRQVMLVNVPGEFASGFCLSIGANLTQGKTIQANSCLALRLC